MAEACGVRVLPSVPLEVHLVEGRQLLAVAIEGVPEALASVRDGGDVDNRDLAGSDQLGEVLGRGLGLMRGVRADLEGDPSQEAEVDGRLVKVNFSANNQLHGRKRGREARGCQPVSLLILARMHSGKGP